MKKIIPILLLIVVIIFVLMFLGAGLGFGKGSGTGEGDGITRSVNVVQENETDATSEKSNNTSEIQYVKVTVSEDDYFYDNEKIKLDNLISKLKEKEGDYILEVIDDQATKNAYDDLLDALDSNNLEYVEK